jgi:tryptophan-rich sensory protein
MGISAARIYMLEDSPGKASALNLFLTQLTVNFFWSLLFFNARAYGFSLLWLLILWTLVFLMIRSFSKLDKKASWLQVPYLVWITFAAYLNGAVWLLNK